MNDLDEVKVFLDYAIRRWREIRNDPMHQHHDKAPCYIDAYQSCRMTIFDELLEAPQ